MRLISFKIFILATNTAGRYQADFDKKISQTSPQLTQQQGDPGEKRMTTRKAPALKIHYQLCRNGNVTRAKFFVHAERKTEIYPLPN